MPLVDALVDRWDVTWRILLKELSAFGVVGAACFVLDLALFQLLYAHVGMGAVTSKLISTVVSMTVAYLGHRYWSFSHRARTGVGREYGLFVMINGVTLLLGLATVAVVRYPLGFESALVLQMANVASTALGTLIRYVSYRRWVFPAHEGRGDRSSGPDTGDDVPLARAGTGTAAAASSNLPAAPHPDPRR